MAVAEALHHSVRLAGHSMEIEAVFLGGRSFANCSRTEVGQQRQGKSAEGPKPLPQPRCHCY